MIRSIGGGDSEDNRWCLLVQLPDPASLVVVELFASSQRATPLCSVDEVWEKIVRG